MSLPDITPEAMQMLVIIADHNPADFSTLLVCVPNPPDLDDWLPHLQLLLDKGLAYRGEGKTAFGYFATKAGRAIVFGFMHPVSVEDRNYA